MTTIRYFIPEDGDEEMYPNVFLAPKPRQQGVPPTLLAVKDAFPLPGHYHFRFKSPLYPGADREKGAMAVWMDVTQDRQPVPTWKNTIVAKVTRLSMEDDDDDDDDFGHRTPAPAPTPVPAAVPAQRGPPSQSSNVTPSSSGPSVDLFGGGPAAAATPAPTANLFDSHPPSAPPSGGSLLDFGPAPAAQPAAHSDFLGMTAPAMQQQQQQAPPPQQQAPPQQRYQPQQAPQSGNYNPYAQQNQPFGDIGSWN